ncbi:MAG: hypothetical protein PHH77_03515 [Victivallaceae bacterium]|nr:hypothetical protein [Victivallaceae bacterium]
MKMQISKVVAETKRLNLRIPYSYQLALYHRPELIDQVANGVGSETNELIYHLTPDTVWGLNINPVSHIHDWMYTFPMVFSGVAEGLVRLRLADHWFDLNCECLFKDAGGWFKRFRMTRLDEYKVALNVGGSEAFWTNKPHELLPGNYLDYYRAMPEIDASAVAKYRQVWNEVVDIEAQLISEKIIKTKPQLKKF